jgi:hypothetical protein
VLKSGVTAHYENLTYKRGALSLLILLVDSPSNPFAVETLLMQPCIEVIKQACGSKTGHEAIIKGVKKHQHEVEQAIRDVITGFDNNTAKSFPRFAKKQTEYYELKYSDIEAVSVM